MEISKNKALEKAVKYYAEKAKRRFKVVTRLPDNSYAYQDINVNDYWLFHVEPEDEYRLDGQKNFILVNKKTGEVISLSIP